MLYFDRKNLLFIDARITAPPEWAVSVTKEDRGIVLQEAAKPGRILSADANGKPIAVMAASYDALAAAVEEILRGINTVYQKRMASIASTYPAHERESWPVQLEEAKALQTDPEATTPWLDACAGARGIDKTELATRVLAKDAAYRLISGHLSGIRQRHEDAIAKLETVEQAQGYDVQAWWPSEEGEPQP